MLIIIVILVSFTGCKKGNVNFPFLSLEADQIDKVEIFSDSCELIKTLTPDEVDKLAKLLKGITKDNVKVYKDSKIKSNSLFISISKKEGSSFALIPGNDGFLYTDTKTIYEVKETQLNSFINNISKD